MRPKAQGKTTCGPRDDRKGRKGPFCPEKRDKERGINRRPSSNGDHHAGVGTSSLEECPAGEEGMGLGLTLPAVSMLSSSCSSGREENRGRFGHRQVCGARGPVPALSPGALDSPRSVMVPPLTGADSESFLVLTAAEGSRPEHPRDGPPPQPTLVMGGPCGGGCWSPTLTCLGQGDLLHIGDGRGLVHILRQVLLLLLTVPPFGFVVGGGGSAKGETPRVSVTTAPQGPTPHSPCPGAGSDPATLPQPGLTPSSHSSSWPLGWARGRASAFASCSCLPSCPACPSQGCSPG